MNVCTENFAAKWTTLSFLTSSPILGELAKLVNDPPISSTCFQTWTNAAGFSSTQFHSGDNAHCIEEPADEFEAVISLTPGHVERIVHAFSRALPGLLTEAIKTLKAQPVRDAESLNGKFMMSESNFTYSYSDLATFFGGLVKVLGTPSVVPSLEENMRREHFACADSVIEFTTGNYGITTTPKLEWEFVVTPQPGRQYPCETVHAQHPRRMAPLDSFLKVMETINTQLTAAGHATLLREEVIALRLYTGPMFAKYNPLLRQVLSGAEFTGNRYVNTIIAINSGILKLSKIQKAVKVFRGLSGGLLPEEFWHPNAHGVKGGVEMAFMSTTTSEEVALQYADSSDERKAAFVFEVQMGMVDRGADISPFSQYPHEKEIVFAPLTGMEVVGTPRIKGRVIVVELRLSCNLSSQTIEQIISKRKEAVLHLCADELQDVQHQVAKRQQTTGISVQPMLNVMEEVKQEEETFFNQSQRFLDSIGQVLDVRDRVLSQLACSAGAAAFRVVAEGDSAALRELVPAYTEELKNAAGSTLLAFAVAQLGPVDAVACGEMVDAIVSLPGFVLTVAGHDKDDKPAYLLAAELGLSAVVHAIISRCGSQQAIDVCGHEVPPAAARVLAATLVACRSQIKNVNGLPLDEIRTAAPSGYVLDLSERLARDRSHVGAWTLGLLLREDQSYLKMESIAWSNDPSKYGIISADNIRSLIGLPGESAEVVLRGQIKGMQPALHFICGLIAGSLSCTALDLSGKFCHSQTRQLSN
ncbi:hypothetical protein CYMTET_20194 [Cymbomonas tetramitiformis]|uniref:ADP ribosyltransferase domain-containing protein n=1 Tax=Cymbomonas tetramitiformis TaxID=36881 RepID=A0AAE0G571_9CHLO|nr:hypothetical protein CYMTET_20194 [Cymbomonas tetramitiformis]